MIYAGGTFPCFQVQSLTAKLPSKYSYDEHHGKITDPDPGVVNIEKYKEHGPMLVKVSNEEERQDISR